MDNITFDEIIKKELLSPVYQPIINLENGIIHCYEGLIRGPENTEFHSPIKLITEAKKLNYIYEFDYIARKNIIEQYTSKNSLLSINVDVDIFNHEEFNVGTTEKILAQYNLEPSDVIIEITEHTMMVDNELFLDIIEHYKQQGYLIAVDDFGAGFSGINRLVEIKPDIIKLDMALIRDIDKDKLKQNMVKYLINSLVSTNITIIAEGIETRDELRTLISLGIKFGQGYYLKKPGEQTSELPREMVQELEELNKFKNLIIDFQTLTVGQICNAYPKFEMTEKTSDIDKFFKKQTSISSVAITNKYDKPIGLVSRNKLHRRMSERYGFELYYNRQVSRIIERDSLIIDCNTSVITAAELAMDRENNEIYEDIIISDQGKYYGIISVKDLLMTTINLEKDYAKNINPLTGLPGNKIINDKINKSLQIRNISYIYVDLNKFKYFNDKYGFEIGDSIIIELKQTLEYIVNQSTFDYSFIGHIGGDDFFAIIKADMNKVEDFIKGIISRFETKISQFFPNESTENLTSIAVGCIYIKNNNHFNSDVEVSKELARLKKEIKDESRKISLYKIIEY